MTNYEWVKAWRKRNPEKVKAQGIRYRAKHPETHKKAKIKWLSKNIERARELDKLRARKNRLNNPEAQKRRSEAYRLRQEAKKTAIAGRPRSNYCEICASEERTVFDHSHRKGHFRGWICDRCNKILGLVRDDKSYLKALIIYLEQTEYEAQYKAA